MPDFDYIIHNGLNLLRTALITQYCRNNFDRELLKLKKMITFGICTYNRKEILLKTAKSLLAVNGIEKANIRIYDDCSTEYDEKFLRQLFPMAKTIFRQEKNVGADKNTSVMYEDFLKSEDEWLFNADSDLIYSVDVINKLYEIIGEQKKVVTLFNCINHDTIESLDKYEIKDSIGAAGCFFNREIVYMILKNIKHRYTGFDVQFSRMLSKEGVQLLATKESYVQHIGVSGYNSRDINFDYGKNFICDSIYNSEVVEETFEHYIASVNEYKKRKAWKIYYFIVSIPRRIKRLTVLLKDHFVNE